MLPLPIIMAELHFDFTEAQWSGPAIFQSGTGSAPGPGPGPRPDLRDRYFLRR